MGEAASQGPSVEELFDRYSETVFRRCNSILRDRELAAEATQDVFVIVIRALPGFRGESSPLTWIYRIATTHCLRLSKRRRFHDNYLHALRRAVPFGASHDSLPAKDLLARLDEKLDDLSREILVYSFIDGLPQEEIAGLVGKSRKTVGKRLQTIREKLQRLDPSYVLPVAAP